MKKIFSLLLVLLLCIGLCACGGNSKTDETPNDNQPDVEEPASPEMEGPDSEEPAGQEATPIRCGDVIDNDNFLMTFDSLEILDEYTYRTSEYSTTSLYVENGYKLLVVKGHFENKSTSAISDSSFSCSALVNGTYEVDGFDVRFNFLRDKNFEIDPYTDMDYVLYINIPEKLAAEFETATFTIRFNDDMSLINTIWNSDGTTTVEADNIYELTSGEGTSGSSDTGSTGAQAADTIAVGDTVTTEAWEITLAKAEVATAIYPVETGGSGIYYEVGDGYKFINLEFDIKNLDTEVRAFSDAVNNVVVHCGKYDYNGYFMYYDMGGSLSVTLLKGTTHGPSPLDPTHLYVETEVPDEAVGAGSITVDLVIAGGQYTIAIQ